MQKYLFSLLDLFLWPFMWIFGGFDFPVQETHAWHVKKYNWKTKGLRIYTKDTSARFGHESPYGLFHMPIFGGLRKFVVLEASGFDKFWNVGFGQSIHSLKICDKRIALLTGKEGFTAYGLADNGKIVKLKILGTASLGDGKFKNLRLF